MTIAIIVAVLLALPAVIFMVECVFGLARLPSVPVGDAPPFALLMPAHDEGRGIQSTVAAVVEQLRPGDRFLIVADNCSDDTADLARGAGAEVVERHDPDRRGKGYALAFGRDALEAYLPPVIIVMDADCWAAPGSLATLAAEAFHRNAAVQGLYLFESESNVTPLVAISNFALLVRNMIRQRGLARLGAPALLQGTGMAFPRAIFATAPLASDDIVEDLNLGLALVASGHGVLWTEAARVGSPAASESATAEQRMRWEHGFLGSALANVPKLIGAAFAQRNPRLLMLALDLVVPPLALLVLLLLVGWVGALALALATASYVPLIIISGAIACVGIAVLLAWSAEGRSVLRFVTLLKTPLYLAWKLPIYLRLLHNRQREWVRTPR
jgi:cellulose synthase/poly-beta-1,6-N-acetylglucosamine synthase-like glycosyltransferase